MGRGTARDRGFRVELLGELEVGDLYWQTVSETADWVLEIDADPSSQITYGVCPTGKWKRANSKLDPYVAHMDHPSPDTGLGFQMRVLLREGAPSKIPDEVRQFLRTSYGIHAYMEGFRVLPYGEPGNDWLEVDRRYAQRVRSRDSHLDPLLQNLRASESYRETPDDALLLLPNRQYLGAVFLTIHHAGKLKTLVNREGFLPDSSYYALTDMVTTGLQLLDRVRASATYEAREARRRRRLESAAEKWKDISGADGSIPTSDALVELTRQSKSIARTIHQQLATGNASGAAASLEKLETALAPTTLLSRELRDEAAMIRVLASVGTQMAAFVHEVNGLVGLSASLQHAVDRIRQDSALPKTATRSLATLSKTLSDLRYRLERQAAYPHISDYT